MLGVKVCFDAKYWAEGYPRTTMHDYCVAAVHGRVKTRPQIKQDGGASSGSIRVDKFNVRSHAESHIVDEVKTAAEEQPNVQPYENIAGDVQLTAHIDPFIPCCSRCQRAVSLARPNPRRSCGNRQTRRNWGGRSAWLDALLPGPRDRCGDE